MAEFKRWGVQPFIAPHGKPKQIRQRLDAQKYRLHGKHIQRGTDIECTLCTHNHGFWKNPVDSDGKHWILDGTGDDGHPRFKEVQLTPNIYNLDGSLKKNYSNSKK